MCPFALDINRTVPLNRQVSLAAHRGAGDSVQWGGQCTEPSGSANDAAKHTEAQHHQDGNDLIHRTASLVFHVSSLSGAHLSPMVLSKELHQVVRSIQKQDANNANHNDD